MVEELQPGDPPSVGPYRLLGRLGGGGMGQVFLGRSPGRKLVAVKVIRPEKAEEPGFRARFAREVAAARQVSGGYTAVVIDDDAQGPVPWLATEYVAGPSLAEAVQAYGPLPAGSVLTLAAGLAEGLAEIHKAGVVHRDLKPSNVLLAHDGPRLIDFGISRAAEGTMLTQTGTVMGTPGYMSPEQAEGGVVGPPSDVFSLGAVLAFAATADGPFGTGSDVAVIYRTIHNEPDTSRLPPQLRPLVLRCLAKDPADRPSTGAILAELGEAQLPADWLPPPVATRLLRYEPNTVTSTAVPRAGTGDTASPAEHRPPEPPRPKRRRPVWAAAIVAALAVAAAVVLLTRPGPPALLSVPRVQGETLAAATSALKAAGFRDIGSGYGCYPSAGAGHVVRQVPAAGARTGPASPVHLYLQAGGCHTVPGVVGLTLTGATSALKASGYDNIPYLYECYGSGDTGDVVRQVPAAGSPTAPALPVHLYLQADNCLTVPDVVGMTLSDAAYTLKQIGFTNIPYLYQCYGSRQIGDVVTQSPAAGTSYGSNQPVSLKLQANNC
jgi:beta-lactam-binding protein with PASTA domain